MHIAYLPVPTLLTEKGATHFLHDIPLHTLSGDVITPKILQFFNGLIPSIPQINATTNMIQIIPSVAPHHKSKLIFTLHPYHKCRKN